MNAHIEENLNLVTRNDFKQVESWMNDIEKMPTSFITKLWITMRHFSHNPLVFVADDPNIFLHMLDDVLNEQMYVLKEFFVSWMICFFTDPMFHDKWMDAKSENETSELVMESNINVKSISDNNIQNVLKAIEFKVATYAVEMRKRYGKINLPLILNSLKI